jgi:putative heme-binding domain-containing protein
MLTQLLSVLLTALFCVPSFAQTDKPTKKSPSRPINALLVTGGCCHDYDRQKLILTRGISARANVRWTVVQQGGKTTNTKIPLYNDPDWAKGFDIVVHNECFAHVKDKEFVDRILKPHREGTPAILIHCAMHCYRTGDDRWFEFVGMQSPGHGAHYTFDAQNVKPDHPIMQGFGDSFTAPKGELYHSMKVFPTATTLASAKRRNDGKAQTCVWVNEYKPTFGVAGRAGSHRPNVQGEASDAEGDTAGGNRPYGCRVFGTTIGHYNETMVEPQYLDMLTKAMLWATKRDPVKDFEPASEKTNAEIAKLVNIPVANKAAKYVPGNCCGEGNLAYGRTVTSKSVQNGNFRKHLTDGRLDTRWCPSGAQVNEWVTVDLEEPREVNHIRLHWEKPTGISYRYIVEVSKDNKTWKQVVDYSKNQKKGAIHAHRIDSKDVRYIRTMFLGADRGLWGSIWELEASADELPKLSNLDTSTPNDATISDVTAPPGFDVTVFGKPPEVNYPVCITASMNGEVFVGVDEQGSLGKEPGRGKVLRCVDTDGDGTADDIKVFAKMDHPRGLIYVGGGAIRAGSHGPNATANSEVAGVGAKNERNPGDSDANVESFVDAAAGGNRPYSKLGGSLWVLHPPFLSVYHDIDGDGVSDDSEVLIKGISTNDVAKRGADHTTNGIAMGIDGWIYIAVGDFGFHKAVGKDGTTLSKRGGGVVRVRPDGTELEIYSWGQRNIVDVAIDPYMNIFTRDNTNDGGGWDIRLSHIMQTANYGYPSLYKNFTEEIMPPLADYGGGSGCGAMFFHDERWPKPYNNILLTCDWGVSKVFSHDLPKNGPTFDAQQSDFLKLPRPTDICADGSGRMYVASWKNGKFNYDGPNIGFVAMVKPSGFVPKPVPDLNGMSPLQLVETLRHPSAKVRLAAQRRLLRERSDEELNEELTKQIEVHRGPPDVDGDVEEIHGPIFTDVLPDEVATALARLVSDKTAPKYTRVAAVYCLKQLHGAGSHDAIVDLAKDGDLRATCIRAIADRRSQLGKTRYNLIINGLLDESPEVKANSLVSAARYFAAVNAESANSIRELLANTIFGYTDAQKIAGVKDVWRSPDPDRVIPHLAVKALVDMNAIDECIAALNGPHRAGALWALKSMHDKRTVDGLFKVLSTARDEELRREVWTTLIRLYHREGNYVEGESPKWWGTRPDTTGPYYHRVKWSESDRIAAAIKVALSEANESLAKHINEQLKRHVVKLDGLSTAEIAAMKKPQKAIAVPKADPNNPNQVGNMPYEKAVAVALKAKGDVANGQKLFVAQSCIACHTFANGQQPKGPHLVDIGKRSKPAELLESMLKPSKKMTQGFDTWTFLLESGKTHTGFVVLESAETVTIRQTDGLSKEFPQDEIEERVKQQLSMMPAGIVNNLTAQQVADLLAYLQSLR